MADFSELMGLIGNRDAAGLAACLAAEPALAATRDENGVSLVMWALYHGQTEMVARIRQDLTALEIFEASALGDTVRVSGLIGSDPEIVHKWSGDGFSPLHLAAFFGRTEMVAILIGAEADVAVHARNPTKVMPLHSAVAGRNPACVSALVQAGAPIDARQQMGYTPLMGAASGGHEEIVKMLLKAGADQKRTSEEGKNARDYAESHGHQRIADLFLES